MFSLRALTRCARLPPKPPLLPLLRPPSRPSTLRLSPLGRLPPHTRARHTPPHDRDPHDQQPHDQQPHDQQPHDRQKYDHLPPNILPPGVLPPKHPPPHRRLYTDPTGRRLSSARPLTLPSARTSTIIVIVLVSGVVLFYLSHLETVPVTGRTRFNMYSSPWTAATVRSAGDAQFQRIVLEMQHQGVPLLGEEHSATRTVRRVLDRLLPYSGMGTEGWEVYVIPDRTVNAFVLPGGKVFVHAGLLEVARGEGGLAAVLGHEIAHVVADHVGERMSTAAGVNAVLYVAMVLSGAVGFGPMLMHYVGNKFLKVVFERPMSRVQEREADYIGLMMMSEACYDPREAVGFWKRMSVRDRDGKEETPEWMSTHPSNENRVEAMRGWMAEAMEKREASDCRGTASFAGAFRKALGRGVIVVV